MTWDQPETQINHGPKFLGWVEFLLGNTGSGFGWMRNRPDSTKALP